MALMLRSDAVWTGNFRKTWKSPVFEHRGNTFLRKIGRCPARHAISYLVDCIHNQPDQFEGCGRGTGKILKKTCRDGQISQKQL